MRMTYQRFMKELRDLDWEWHFTTTGIIRCRRGGHTYSPISAVYQAMGGARVSTGAAFTCMQRVFKMRNSVSTQIEGASCVPDWRRRTVRRDLVRATKILDKSRIGTMSLKGFFYHLRRTRVKWSLDAGRIRGRLNGRVCCPITAVAEHLLGESYGIDIHQSAARDIGLSNDTARSVFAAIDEATLTPTRKKLLRACRIKR